MSKASLAHLRQVFLVQQPADIQRDGRAMLIKAARDGIAQITSQQTARAGIEPGVEVYVNSPANHNIDAVALPGPIVALFDYRREAAIFGITALEDASPVDSGAYRAAHQILVNNVRVDRLPGKLRPNDLVVLTNFVDYARRIEVGRTKEGRAFLLKLPNRIYERVAKRVLIPKYRGTMDIQFGYIDLTGAYITKGKLSLTYKTGGTRKRGGKFGAKGTPSSRTRKQKAGSVVRAPAIFIRFLGA